ncbi:MULTISPECIES: bacteriocin immunity protein [Clostridium]|uniref:bacteriocin immunity protein n=1 Tax=Clostridium TaxID=1485 RepID=UPI0008255A41|nr:MULTISPECIES: bacteriocin immunity protein [Clostridium]PJI10440.1 bacteriocin immunity protein [Clostridium sp. CT7]
MEDKEKSIKSSKDLVHALYNSIAQSKKSGFEDIKEELLKIYVKLDVSNEKNIPLIDKLVKYIYYTAYIEKLHFSSYEDNIIRELSEMSKYTGLKGVIKSLSKARIVR